MPSVCRRRLDLAAVPGRRVSPAAWAQGRWAPSTHAMVHADPSDLGAALTDALLDRAMPARMGLAARALAESGYTPSHCAAQYLSLVMGQQSCLTARTHALGQKLVVPHRRRPRRCHYLRRGRMIARRSP